MGYGQGRVRDVTSDYNLLHLDFDRSKLWARGRSSIREPIRGGPRTDD